MEMITMRIKCLQIVLVLLSIAAPACLSAAPTCDRQCLVTIMQNYLAALVKHDPAAVPFDKYVKFTENAANIPVGYGLWVTASGGPSEFQIYAADPVAQQVAALVMMQETGDTNELVAVRLRLQRGKIIEAEHDVMREGLLMANLQKPRPGLVEDVAPADRTPRDQMVDIGLSYYDALADGDGTLAPFAEECERHVDGHPGAWGTKAAPIQAEPKPESAPPEHVDPEMAKLDAAEDAAPRPCAAQMSSGVFAYITEIRNRRLLVVDEQKGLAVGFSNFYHAGKLKTIKLKGVPGVDSMPSIQRALNIPSVHFFKIKKGKIYDIEATGVALPYGTKSGWEE